MAAPNILDPQLVNIFPHMPPEHQRQGVDILKNKCTEIENAGSLDAQLALMGNPDGKSLPEEKLNGGGWIRSAILATYQVPSCETSCAHYPPIASKALTCSIQLLHASKKQHPT